MHFLLCWFTGIKNTRDTLSISEIWIADVVVNCITCTEILHVPKFASHISWPSVNISPLLAKSKNWFLTLHCPYWNEFMCTLSVAFLSGFGLLVTKQAQRHICIIFGFMCTLNTSLSRCWHYWLLHLFSLWGNIVFVCVSMPAVRMNTVTSLSAYIFSILVTDTVDFLASLFC